MQKKLLDSGACDLVCALSKLHIEDSSVFFCASKALCGLSSLTSEIRECLGAEGGCEIILQGLEMHKSNMEILRDCVEIIMHLSLSPNNSVKFTKLEAAKCILGCLDQNLMEEELGVELCSGALLNLIVYGDEIKQGRENLIEYNALSILRRAKSSTRASYRARENVNRILSMLENDGKSAYGENVLVGVVLGSEYKKGISPLKAELRRTRYKYSACDSEHNSSDDGDYSYGNFYVASGEDVETKSESSHNNSISSGNSTPLPFNSHGNRARARTASHNTSNNSMDEYLGGFESRNIIEM